jgi:hypothetical protein
MPRVEILGPNTADGFGTRLLVGGRELEGVTDIGLAIGLAGPTCLTVQLLALEGVSFTGHAEVHVSVHIPDGFELVATPQPDGSTIYRTRQVTV